jgi:hypothetical protein
MITLPITRRTGLFEDAKVQGYILEDGESFPASFRGDFTKTDFEAALRKVSRRRPPSSEASSGTSE